MHIVFQNTKKHLMCISYIMLYDALNEFIVLFNSYILLLCIV